MSWQSNYGRNRFTRRLQAQVRALETEVETLNKLQNFTESVPAGTTSTIPADRQAVIFGQLIVDGTLVVDGELLIK